MNLGATVLRISKFRIQVVIKATKEHFRRASKATGNILNLDGKVRIIFSTGLARFLARIDRRVHFEDALEDFVISRE